MNFSKKKAPAQSVAALGWCLVLPCQIGKYVFDGDDEVIVEADLDVFLEPLLLHFLLIQSFPFFLGVVVIDFLQFVFAVFQRDFMF